MSATRCAIWLAAAMLGTIPRAGAQGPLAPAAAPGPMMKTLGEIEPRTPITNIPYTIVQPGTYYLVSNLTSATDGVIIRTNDVVLDLMGFALAGDRSSSGDIGVYLEGTNAAPILDVVVRNGSIHDFGYGVRMDHSRAGRLEGLAVASNAFGGIWLYGRFGKCSGNAILDCAVHDNGGEGIFFYGYGGQCDGNVIDGCAIVRNLKDGVTFSGTGGQSDGNALLRSTVVGCSSNGVYLDGTSSGRCVGNRVADCAIVDNGQMGIYLNGTSSGTCHGNAISGCTVAGNGDMGMLLTTSGSGTCNDNTVENCVVDGNVDSGIHLVYARGTRVEGNHVCGQTGLSYGISAINASSNLIVRNTCVGQGNNFVMDPDDTYGPVVTNKGALPNTGTPAHPWANFSR